MTTEPMDNLEQVATETGDAQPITMLLGTYIVMHNEGDYGWGVQYMPTAGQTLTRKGSVPTYKEALALVKESTAAIPMEDEGETECEGCHI